MEETKRKLCSIQRITKLESIKDADRIELAEILGWHVIVLKSENYKVGDLVCYVEVDSLLPLRPEFAFLGNGSSPKKMIYEGKEIQGWRIKTKKMKGVISQGIVFPLSIFELAERIALKEGDDVTLAMGVVKYELPISPQLAGKVRGGFPGFIKKTDEIRIQAYPQLLEKYQGVKFYTSEKCDGSSASGVIKNGEFHVCSRNLDLLETEDNTIWKVMRKLKIEETLHKMNNSQGGERFALQGEIVGGGIQKNPLKINGQTIYFFNIYDFVDGKYIDYETFKGVTELYGIPTVPIIDEEYYLPKTVDVLVEYATRKSLINKDSWAEGVVFRPLIEQNDEDLDGRLSFKCINPEYLLKHE